MNNDSARWYPSPERLGQCVLLLGIAAWLLPTAATAFDELAPAQALVYDTAHMANTQAGEVLDYRYLQKDQGTQDLDDSARLEVVATHADGRRDIALDFLSEVRHIPTPDFDGWRGNPVLLVMFERLAQDFSAETGGGAIYFRNRIRDAMASEAADLSDVDVAWQGEQVAAQRLSFRPFAKDAYLGARPRFASTEVELIISELVPGGVLSVSAEALAADGNSIHLRSLELVEATR